MIKITRVETVYGPLLAFEDDYITTQIRRFGAHTRPEVAFLLSAVQPGDAVFDLGAHIGTFAIALAQKVGPGGSLLAVEANSETFQLLRGNLRQSGTVALNALIAPKEDRYEIHRRPGNTGGTYFLPSGNGAAFDCTSIDALCSRYFTPRVVKVDIEGGEFAALSGTRLLKEQQPIFYCEINARMLGLQGSSSEAMERLFRDAGYRMFRNIGPRHAARDDFIVSELDAFPAGLNNFDVLAIHRADARLNIIAGIKF